MLDVAEVHDIKTESAEPAVADVPTVFDPLWHAERAVIAGPRRAVSGEDVFLVLLFLVDALAGNPPARDFLDVRRVGHIDDHDGIAEGPLVVFHSELIVPAAIEIRIF